LRDAVVAHLTNGNNVEGAVATARAVRDSDWYLPIIDEVVALVIDSAAVGLRLAADDAVSVVARIADRANDLPDVQAILQRVSRHVLECARQPRIPAEFIGTMLRHQLVNDPAPRILSDVLRIRPDALHGARLDATETRTALRCLAHLRGEALFATVPSLLPLLADPQDNREIEEILGHLSPDEAAQCVLAAAASVGHDVSVGLSAICERQALALLRHAARSVGATKSTARLQALELLGLGQSSDSAHAASTLRSLVGGRIQRSVNVSQTAAGIKNGNVRSAVLEFAFAAAVENARDDRDVASVWNELRAVYPGTDPHPILRRLLWLCDQQRRGQPQAIVLSWIARSVIDDQPNLVTTFGNFRDRELETLARSVAAGTPDWCLDREDASVQAAGRRARLWWDVLLAHQRKLSKAQARGRGLSRRAAV
jgi:hypothetical protein